jgi:hypothetical protein
MRNPIVAPLKDTNVNRDSTAAVAPPGRLFFAPHRPFASFSMNFRLYFSRRRRRKFHIAMVAAASTAGIAHAGIKCKLACIFFVSSERCEQHVRLGSNWIKNSSKTLATE